MKNTAESNVQDIDIQKDKVKKAIEKCQLALQKDPNNTNLHIRLGDLYLE